MGRTFKDRTDWSRKDRQPRFKRSKNNNFVQYRGLSVAKDNEYLDDDRFVEYEEEKEKFQR